ncbi:MAG TPA: hypothetical protein VFS00_21615, partial [Polyangiaceae bacterium]|nr:hypothetical protein [Polyangiaceae bacterium]
GEAGASSTGSGLLQEGQPAPSNLRCGSVSSQTTSSYSIDGLKDGQNYRIGIASTDLVGNPGTLSKVVCVTPQRVDDFYQLYRDAGGDAGGGYCNLRAPGGERGRFAVFVVVGLFAAAFAARRRPS